MITVIIIISIITAKLGSLSNHAVKTMYTLPAEELLLRSTQPKHRKQRPACPTGPRERDGFVKPVYGCHWKRCQSCLQLSSIFQEDTFFYSWFSIQKVESSLAQSQKGQIDGLFPRSLWWRGWSHSNFKLLWSSTWLMRDYLWIITSPRDYLWIITSPWNNTS